jgi:hypothetical protein
MTGLSSLSIGHLQMEELFPELKIVGKVSIVETAYCNYIGLDQKCINQKITINYDFQIINYNRFYASRLTTLSGL